MVEGIAKFPLLMTTFCNEVLLQKPACRALQSLAGVVCFSRVVDRGLWLRFAEQNLDSALVWMQEIVD